MSIGSSTEAKIIGKKSVKVIFGFEGGERIVTNMSCRSNGEGR